MRSAGGRGRGSVGAEAPACHEGAGPPVPRPPEVSGRAAVTWRAPPVFSSRGACFGEPLGPTAMNPRGVVTIITLSHTVNSLGLACSRLPLVGPRIYQSDLKKETKQKNPQETNLRKRLVLQAAKHDYFFKVRILKNIKAMRNAKT